MDMNFPHKGLEWLVLDEGQDVSDQFADQQALLAKAIARQTSSQSAQQFVAAKQELGSAKRAISASFMDDRMAFFAGRPRSEMAGQEEEILFRTGSFRPDLAQQEINKMKE
ncbi:hypothetical protein [Sphingorhabdus sp. M41]|uniref:hypothetical protein n=1 Tax=Sphingorhabdus sp. M41 TaxID=1806885 RepID=UPI00078B9AEB|nr:hypothetical protein [Sphingorhabdus sp. M41]AMO70687.1 hypothetical protein AZE99_01425 [Sphingorhabdus sp. M41]